MTDDILLEEIKRGDEQTYSTLYKDNREAFIAYAKKIAPMDEDSILEIYQEAMVLLYENAVSGKIIALHSSVKTYLFSIGRNKIYEYLRAEKKKYRLDDGFLDIAAEDLTYEEIRIDEMTTQYKTAFAKLGSRCQRVLELFYLQGKSIRQIVQEENYENENTVKAQKSRCLKQLRELVKK